MTPPPDTIILHHGTTLHRAKSIEANGPDPNFKEPKSLVKAEGFSAQFTDGRGGTTGVANDVAFLKDRLFPNEGGPAILEVEVPSWIMDILFQDIAMGGVAQSGEARFERRFGLEELLQEWPNITKRIIVL